MQLGLMQTRTGSGVCCSAAASRRAARQQGGGLLVSQADAAGLGEVGAGGRQAGEGEGESEGEAMW